MAKRWEEAMICKNFSSIVDEAGTVACLYSAQMVSNAKLHNS